MCRAKWVKVCGREKPLAVTRTQQPQNKKVIIVLIRRFEIKQEIDHNVCYCCRLPGRRIRDCNKRTRNQSSFVVSVKCFFDGDNKTDDNVIMSVKSNSKVSVNEYVVPVTIHYIIGDAVIECCWRDTVERYICANIIIEAGSKTLDNID